MSIVVVFYRDRFPVKHVFEDYSDALEFASLTYQEEYVQSITIDYERTEEE